MIGDFYDIAAGQHLHPNLIVGGEVALVEGDLTDRRTTRRRARIGNRRDDIAIDWACERRRCSAHESEHYDRKYRKVPLLAHGCAKDESRPVSLSEYFLEFLFHLCPVRGAWLLRTILDQHRNEAIGSLDVYDGVLRFTFPIHAF